MCYWWLHFKEGDSVLNCGQSRMMSFIRVESSVFCIGQVNDDLLKQDHIRSIKSEVYEIYTLPLKSLKNLGIKSRPKKY